MQQEQLMGWTQNLTYNNKWDRLAFSNKGSYIIAWVWTEEEKFHANVLNVHTHEGDSVSVSKKGMASLEEAKAFADTELKKQGYKV